MKLRHKFETDPEYIPSAADEACKDALSLKGEHERSLKEIDPLLWARGKVGWPTGRYAGQVSDEELSLYFLEKGVKEWDPHTVAFLRQRLDENYGPREEDILIDGPGLVR